MREISILTADDDAGMRLVMRRLIEKSEGYTLVGEAENGDELLRLYDEKRPDVVLMDVEMPGKSGIECARAIQDKDPFAILVFATAHEEYMKSAFEVYAFDYLVKPFRAERALNTLRLIRERLEGARDESPVDIAPRKPAVSRLMLRHKDGVSFINPAEIALVQREERSTVICLSDNTKYTTSDALGDIEKRLPETMFFRTHKSYIVNLSYIDSVSPYGRWTYIVKLRGMKPDALMTRERYEALQQMFS